ncbi:hypothetical protein [Streptomyces sp. NPDC002343]
MSIVRQLAPGQAAGLHRRLALLVLVIVVAGGPWAQRPLLDFYTRHFYIERSENDLLRWVTQAAFSPGWDVSADRYAGTGALIANDLSVLVLLAALVLLISWLSARGGPGWGGCLTVGVLTALLANLAGLGLLVALVDDAPLAPADTLAVNLGRGSLIFGLALGVLLALLFARPPRGPAPRRTGSRPGRPHHAEGRPSVTTAPLNMPVGREPGDVTRYLCAAAYVDERFADRVVEDVLADEAGAVAPSPGVDLEAVARHCLAAQDLRHTRDLRLTAAFAVVALLAPVWLVGVRVMLSAVRQTGGRPSLATRGRHQPDGGTLLRLGVTAGVVAFLALTCGIAFSSLPVDGFPAWLLGTYLAGVPAVLASLGAAAFAYVTVVRHDLDVDRLLRTTLTRKTFTTQPADTAHRPQWVTDRMETVKDARDGNVTVYSGYAPYVGYTATSSQWSLAVPLLPAENAVGLRSHPAGPRPFTTVDIVGHLRERLRSVAAPETDGAARTAEEEALASLTVEDRVFVNGTTIGTDDRFTSTTTLAPVTQLPAETVEKIMLRPTGTVRHCLAVHVPMWGGDVVPSTFLHLATVGSTLHLHIDHHVLGPVRAAYHVVDRLDGSLSAAGKRGLLANAVLHTGPALVSAPFRALRHARFDARRLRRMGDELTAIEQDPLYDYGARVSVRELALSPDYHNYFQVLDAQRIISLVERHTFAAVRDFLDSHGYDTTDFRAQQQTILNQGLIQQGGTSIIGNQAIGAGATATQNFPKQAGATAPGSAGVPGQ